MDTILYQASKYQTNTEQITLNLHIISLVRTTYLYTDTNRLATDSLQVQ